MKNRYIFLVRHGSRAVEPMKSECEHHIKDEPSPVLDPASPKHTRTERIAGALADQLERMGEPITRILFSPHVAAWETAEMFRQALAVRKCLSKDCKLEASEALAPETSRAKQGDFARQLSGSGLLLLGHQPQLTDLARSLLGQRLPAQTLPLGGSEVACIRLGENPGLLWLLTEKSPNLQADLRDKIRSKFDVAKFFIGALVINASVLLSTPVSNVWAANMSWTVAVLMIAGSVALTLSLGFAVGTLLAFDRLTMPAEFWAEKHRALRSAGNLEMSQPSRWSVLRPPSEATVVLFYEMMHTWKSLFQPALIAAVVSIACFLLAIAASKLGLRNQTTLLAAAALLICGALLVRYYSEVKPALGFED